MLAESFLEQHPGAHFAALVVDDSGDDVEVGPAELVRPSDIGVDEEELHRLATMYTAQGLVSSLKPQVLAWLTRERREPALLLDADSLLYADLGQVGALAERHSIVLSPHTLEPTSLGLDGDEAGVEELLLLVGVMNGGFLAVARDAQRFLAWWCERTARHCIHRTDGRRLVLSQAWLTIVPALFEHHVLRDRGCNVAYWNLGGRDVEWRAGRPTIEGTALRHFHFAGGFDPLEPDRLVASEESGPWAPPLDQRPGVARLCREYAERLLGAGYCEARPIRPRFDSMPGGTPIDAAMRATYRDALIRAESSRGAEPPNPFTDGAERFIDWLEFEPGATAGNGQGDNRDDALAELELLRAELERMRQSRSWRFTRPLRSWGAALERLRGGSRPQ